MRHLSRWQRRYLAASIVAVLLASGYRRSYFAWDRQGVFFGLAHSDGHALCGFIGMRSQVAVAAWRRDGTVVFGAGAIRVGRWYLGANAVDARGQLAWQRSFDLTAAWRALGWER